MLPGPAVTSQGVGARRDEVPASSKGLPGPSVTSQGGEVLAPSKGENWLEIG